MWVLLRAEARSCLLQPGSQHIREEEEEHSPAFCMGTVGLVQKTLKQVKTEAHAYVETEVLCKAGLFYKPQFVTELRCIRLLLSVSLIFKSFIEFPLWQGII